MVDENDFWWQLLVFEIDLMDNCHPGLVIGDLPEVSSTHWDIEVAHISFDGAHAYFPDATICLFVQQDVEHCVHSWQDHCLGGLPVNDCQVLLMLV